MVLPYGLRFRYRTLLDRAVRSPRNWHQNAMEQPCGCARCCRSLPRFASFVRVRQGKTGGPIVGADDRSPDGIPFPGFRNLPSNPWLKDKDHHEEPGDAEQPADHMTEDASDPSAVRELVACRPGRTRRRRSSRPAPTTAGRCRGPSRRSCGRGRSRRWPAELPSARRRSGSAGRGGAWGPPATTGPSVGEEVKGAAHSRDRLDWVQSDAFNPLL